MTTEQVMEHLSRAYLHALCSVEYVKFDTSIIDDDSVDATISYTGTPSLPDGLDAPTDKKQSRSPKIDVQLKSTASLDRLGNGTISFPLKKKNYDDLRSFTGTPRLLIVLDLPSISDEWLKLTQDELAIRKCAYWLNLLDMPENPNIESVTVHIPPINILNRSKLKQFLFQSSFQQYLI
jgi:Domain of unknown function (DUF4365)